MENHHVIKFSLNIFTHTRTCLWAHTTDPRSFQDPPRLSIRTIRRIWKNRRPLRVEAANTGFPAPSTSTKTLATITTISRQIHHNTIKLICVQNILPYHDELWIVLQVEGFYTHTSPNQLNVLTKKNMYVNVRLYFWLPACFSNTHCHYWFFFKSLEKQYRD